MPKNCHSKRTVAYRIAVSSLSNEGHLRGSGQLLFDAYTVVELEREDSDDPHNTKIVATIKKNRYGPASKCVVIDRDEYGNIVEV